MENMKQKMDEFKKLTKPIGDWLRENEGHFPYGSVIVTSENAVLTTSLMGIPFVEKEEKTDETK